MKGIKNVLSVLLRISISIVLLVLLFKFNKIDTGALIGDIKSANKAYLSIGLAITIFIYFLGFLRWKMLVKATGITIPLGRLISSFSGGVFFSIFLPSTIGGDLVRSVDLAGHTKKAKEVVATVFLDRLSGYIGLVLVVLIALFLGRDLILDRIVFSSVLAIIAVLIAVLLILFNKFIYSKISGFLTTPNSGKIRELIKDIHQEIHVFGSQKKIIIFNLTISFIIQVLFPLGVYYIGLALGIKISFIYFLIFLPLISAITLLPVAIGGLGLREGLFVLYFAKAGVIKQLALAMSLLSFSFIVFTAAIGGIIYVLTVHHRRLQPDQSSPL